MSFNKIIVIGNLGRDPELRYTPQGNAVCNFSVATSEKKRDKAGEMQEVTTWFRVTTWNKQAENASKYLTKGRPVYVEGRLRIEEWTDRDGKNRYTLEVNATDLQFLGSQSDHPSSDANSDQEFSQSNDFQTDAGTAASAPTDEDIPF
jgi:single-strand DNA-binding protein